MWSRLDHYIDPTYTSGIIVPVACLNVLQDWNIFSFRLWFFMVDFSCSVFEHKIAMKETCVLQYYECCQSTILAGKSSKIEINVSRLRETGTPSKGKKRQKSEMMHKRQHCDTSHILDPINFLLKSHTYRSKNPFFTLLQAVYNERTRSACFYFTSLSYPFFIFWGQYRVENGRTVVSGHDLPGKWFVFAQLCFM